MYQQLKTLEDYNETINSDIVHVIKFGASWCAPCKTMDNVLQELSEEMKYIKFKSIDINDVAKECTDLGIRTVPTILKFQNGKAIDRKIGIGSKEDYKLWLTQE